MEYTGARLTPHGTPTASRAAKYHRVIHHPISKEEEMSPISTPTKRTYYTASPTEKDRLRLWIPIDELEGMVEEDLLPASVLDEYPDGAEVEVTPAGFEELGIDLGVSPEALTAVYGHLLERGEVPPSGLVDGAALERIAREAPQAAEETGPAPFSPEALERIPRLTERELPEPEMTEGEEAEIFLRDLE